MPLKGISPEQLKQQLTAKSCVLLDIREAYEYDDDHLDSVHIPMAEVKMRLHELENYKDIVVCCKSGKRAQAVTFMLQKQLKDKQVSYLIGGLEAYRSVYAKK